MSKGCGPRVAALLAVPQCRPAGYTPRHTPRSDLLRIVGEHLPDFIERTEQQGHALPKFVLSELRGLLRCGDFEHGFIELHCRRCGDDLRVPFSCKGRGICPSCIGRRMSELAAGWVDRLLPPVPYRQWVLSFDSSLAFRLGYDANALGVVCKSFARRVLQSIRHRTKGHCGCQSVASLHPGIIIVVQRFRADCGLFVHLHALVSDGAWQQQPDGRPVFRPAPPLTDLDLDAVLRRVAADLAKADLDEDVDVNSTLAACAQLSLSTPAVVVAASAAPDSLNVCGYGMNLHAATSVDGRDRKRLERLCRYLLRPPFAQDAVHRLPDGRVRLELPRKARYVDMTPHQWLAKLVALVPPPKIHTLRYGGVFSNRHHIRPSIIPTPPTPVDQTPVQLALLDSIGNPLSPAGQPVAGPTSASRSRRLSWGRLLARVFAVDVTQCPCGGRLEVTSIVTDPDEIARRLHAARPPPRQFPTGQLLLPDV